MDYMPFFMVYRAEAVLPSVFRHDSPRVAAYVEADNEQARQDALNLLDEKRDLAVARPTIYQQDLRHYHSRRVKSTTFQEGDLVLRLIQDQTNVHKLSPPWEGPFVVSKNLNNGSYYLIDIREHKDSRKSEEETRRLWNIAHLLHLSHRLLWCTYFDNVYIMMIIIKQGLCHFIFKNNESSIIISWSLGGLIVFESLQ